MPKENVVNLRKHVPVKMKKIRKKLIILRTLRQEAFAYTTLLQTQARIDLDMSLKKFIQARR